MGGAVMDDVILKLLPDLGSAGLAAVLMFGALRYVVTSCNTRAESDRELFKAQYDALRGSYERLTREERASHEREMTALTGDFKICIERLSSSSSDIADQVRRLRSGSGAH
jgi:hypothetical protein